jgi:hypothetical protein
MEYFANFYHAYTSRRVQVSFIAEEWPEICSLDIYLMAASLHKWVKQLTTRVDVVCTDEIEGCILDALLTIGATLIARKPQYRARGQDRYGL